VRQLNRLLLIQEIQPKIPMEVDFSTHHPQVSKENLVVIYVFKKY
jgi:hypothetical protein